MKRTAEISVNRIKVYAHHGCHPQERIVGGDFYVTVSALTEVEPSAWQDDRMEGTADYSLFVDIVRREMAVPSKLLEHVAGRIVSAIEAAFPSVTSIDLELTKLNPPMGADCDGAGVEIHLINDKTE